MHGDKLDGKFTKTKDLSGFDHMHKMQLMYIFSMHDVYRKEQLINCTVVSK
jgi:hypothetical protein